jgi:hypothetical protein
LGNDEGHSEEILTKKYLSNTTGSPSKKILQRPHHSMLLEVVRRVAHI